MRKIFSALVGMAGLAAAVLILLMAFDGKILNAAIAFTVIGEIPGTHTQLGFMSTILSSTALLVGGLSFVLYRRHATAKLLQSWSAHSKNDTSDEPSEPFDGEDIIMIAKELEEFDLFGRHQSLPVQLQLF